MGDSIQAVGSSISALSEYYRVITHNLANANTSGYKRRVEAIRQSITDASAGGVTGGTSIDFTPGAMIRTGRSLDMAIQGRDGFFVIETPEGPLYTRNGVFRLNPQGQLVNADGQTVSGEGGQIVIPNTVGPSGVSVATDGQISADGQAIGKLKIVEFDDPAALKPIGNNCFRAPPTATPKAAEKTTVYQGFQEAANVNVVEELVDLIMVTRMYEANMKSIKVQDERMKNILQVAMA